MRFVRVVVYFGALALMWIGAEWVFEGAVHTSAVDAVFCALLARSFVDKEDDE